MSAVNKEALSSYRDSVDELCLMLAKMNQFSKMLEKGDTFRRSLFVYVCEEAIRLKQIVLETKEKLGFKDGFSFTEDNSFLGFSIKGGALIREPGVTDDDIYHVVDKWFYGFPATANHYQFEVAHYVVALTEADSWGVLEHIPEEFCKEIGVTEDNYQ